MTKDQDLEAENAGLRDALSFAQSRERWIRPLHFWKGFFVGTFVCVLIFLAGVSIWQH